MPKISGCINPLCMKVLHIVNTLSAGGAELQLLTLVRGLKTFGVEQRVACLKEHVTSSESLRNRFEAEGVRVFDLGARHLVDISCVSRAFSIGRSWPPDVVHTHLPRADVVGAFMRLRGLAPVWVASIHDIYKNSWRGKHALPLLCQIWNKADAVVGISGAVRDWLVNEQGISQDRVRVIHYGIECDSFFQSKDVATEGSYVIGTIGRLEARKGHEYLIKAMIHVLKKFPHAQLHILGHDPDGYGVTLRSLIRELRLEDAVFLLGFDADVKTFLSRLELFAFASLSEGFGQVVVEAMAASKLVIVSDIAPLTEIVDSNTGILVPARDERRFAHEICWALEHPTEARAFGMRARERAILHFSAQRMSAEVIRLYGQLSDREKRYQHRN